MSPPLFNIFHVSDIICAFGTRGKKHGEEGNAAPQGSTNRKSPQPRSIVTCSADDRHRHFLILRLGLSGLHFSVPFPRGD